ncbi:MAG: 30S ribosomal protein S4 [Candidatus Doudnabacteria bacterium]|nr:30S ribosomal protein S4 [Candidatus Doudnabacteria bacterium]
MRYTGPKAKKARRLGMAFTSKDARILQRRAFPPGQHGQNRVRVSEYGMQLREKQKMKINYGVQEKQFRNYFDLALRQPGVTGDNLLRLLESRLDNIVYRLGIAQTRAQARQLVSHGFFSVNGKKVDIPSYSIRVGDTISVKENKRKAKIIQNLSESLKSHKAQDWLEFNLKEISGKVISLPNKDLVENSINTQLIVEHYSRN